MTLQLLGAFVFLLLSGFFSGIEIAFISASRLHVELKRQHGSKRGHILARFYEKPSEFLGTTLVGNNIALVVFSFLLEGMLETPLKTAFPILDNTFGSLLVLTIITTFVVLIFGEFLPKVLFRLNANHVLFWLTYPLYFIKVLLFPIVWVTVKLSYLILKVLLRTEVTDNVQVFTRLDLELFIKNITPESQDDIDTELFENALYLPSIRVKDCMVPRTEIKGVDISEGVGKLRELFIDTRLSKLIIYDDTFDNILGYVHHQQMLDNPNKIKPLVLPIPIVPMVMGARELMNRFIKQQVSMACVVDEFGGTAGIITLEDILEEIVGEIEDEHDDEDLLEKKINDYEYVFSGRMEVAYINEKYDLNIPIGDYATLSGYIVTTAEIIPKEKQEFTFEPYRFVLEVVSETKIERVRVFELASEHEDE